MEIDNLTINDLKQMAEDLRKGLRKGLQEGDYDKLRTLFFMVVTRLDTTAEIIADLHTSHAIEYEAYEKIINKLDGQS